MTLQTCIVQHAFLHHLLLLVLLTLLQTWRGCCHPQCLDFKPPFEPQQPLVFCKEYSKFGCCDLEQDEVISMRFYAIMGNFDHSGYMTCGKYIRSILCQVRETLWPCLSFPWQPDLLSIAFVYESFQDFLKQNTCPLLSTDI